MARETREKYGLNWTDHDDLQIELSMILRGGYWLIGGQKYGLGLFEHFMRARELTWPERYRHRWTDLLYHEFISNIVTILMGAGSTQKTSHAAEFVLLDYWANPSNTLVLVSTTTVDKLDLAVFGELTMLHKAAQERWPWLPGNRITSKRAISTDNLEEEKSRDIRKGIIGRACFFPGSMVDTPSGKRAIETLRVGEKVIGAFGPATILETMNRSAQRILRVVLNDGRELLCTPEHPILTARGWIRAVDLRTCDRVFSAGETLSLLQEDTSIGISESEVLQRPMSRTDWADSNLSTVRRRFPEMETSSGKILQPGLCGDVGVKTPEIRHQISVQALREKDCRTREPEILQRRLPPPANPYRLSCMWEKFHLISGRYFQETESFLQFILRSERKIDQTEASKQFSYARGDDCLESISRDVRMEWPNPFGDSQIGWEATLVQGGHRVSRNKTRRGNRRSDSLGPEDPSQRSCKIPSFAGAWVDRVEIYQPRSKRGSPACQGNYRVYNLEIEGHPSYSVNGVIVHNCYVGKQYVGLGTFAGIKQQRIRFLADELQFMASTFFDCLPNMFQSAGLDADGQPEVKVIGSGNPKHDPFDMLSVAAEPVDGWDSVAHVEKTTCWDTKFHRGRCVNLIGTDSPNFDPPVSHVPRYPRLISQNTVNLVLKRWKKDSLQYYSQCLGKMVIGMIGDRVITKQLCEEHHAFEKPTWRDNAHTKIGFLDPAWGGVHADRCVWGWLRFGLDLKNIMILELVEMHVVPIMASIRKDPDDQIAEYVKQQATLNDIPADNIFYDSTGRGTTGAAFAKVYGSIVPVPVAFGDRPSQRAVRHDLFIEEPNGRKRHKRCDEEYGKRVTELWFAVRNIIECDQFRGMTEDVCREGCMREYTLVAGGKIDVETKDETRERMGESPDLFDALAVGIEGARQRGFKTQRLGWEIIENDEDEDFFETEANQYQQMIKGALLKH